METLPMEKFAHRIRAAFPVKTVRFLRLCAADCRAVSNKPT